MTNTSELSLNIQASKVSASTIGSQKNFIEMIASTAKHVADSNDLYPSVMIAQAILESSWGERSLSKAPYYNLFGIQGSYKGNSVSMLTQEYINGEYVNKKKLFRQYSSLEESFIDNAHVLRTTDVGSGFFYQKAWRSNTTNYRQATDALTGTYATSPNYGQTLNNIISQYDLDRFDNEISDTRTNLLNSQYNITSQNDSYTVKSGDTLWGISQENNLTVDKIKNLNNLTSNTIYLGQILKLYEKTKISDQYTTVYRIYNTETKEHLYTVDSYEIDALLKSNTAWIDEGVAFHQPQKSDTPVYRLINTKTNEHFFTADNSLANQMIAELEKDGWQNDTMLISDQHDTESKTIAFYSADNSAESLPVISLHNPKAGIGQNFYTTSSYEANVLKSEFNWKVSGSFKQKEGVSWYALNQTTSGTSSTLLNKEAASNFPITEVPLGWSISTPVDTVNFSSATYDFRQCTWFAWNRARQFGISYSPYMGNGQDWQSNAAYKITKTPTVHSVVSFKAGQFGFSSQYGHVAFVEAVNADGSILVSESGLGYSSLYVY